VPLWVWEDSRHRVGRKEGTAAGGTTGGGKPLPVCWAWVGIEGGLGWARG